MKTINRTHLPEQIIYNGKTYVNDIEFKNQCKNWQGKISKEKIQMMIRCSNKSIVFVKVLQGSLKGKLNLFNQPYKPTEWIYTTNK